MEVFQKISTEERAVNCVSNSKKKRKIMATKKKSKKANDRLSKLREYNAKDYESLNKDEREEYKRLLKGE